MNLKNICESLQVKADVIMECGAGPRLEMESLLSEAKKVILVDPLGSHLVYHTERLRGVVSAEVVTHEVAITRERGEAVMIVPPTLRGKDNSMGISGTGSGFIKDGPVSPAARGRRGGESTHVKRWLRKPVTGVHFSDIDSGDIDVLVLDCEGSEWLVLQTMISRPKVIVIEIFGIVRKRNIAIREWMVANGYKQHSRFGVNRVMVKI